MYNNKDWYDIYKEGTDYIEPSTNLKIYSKRQQERISTSSQNTRQLDLEYGHFCYYCGKEMKSNKVYVNRECYEYFTCSCENALKEQEIKKRLSDLEIKKQTLENILEELPKCDVQAQYNAEYKALNRKYGVER